jgi:hypothetical protein
MEQKPEQEQRDWTGYGSAERQVVVEYYLVQDKHGVFRLISINDYAIWDLFGDQKTFELHLAARYCSLDFVGSGRVIVKPADHTGIITEGTQELKRRIEELRAQHLGICTEMWMPESVDSQKLEEPAIAPTTKSPDKVPGDSGNSSKNRIDDVLVAISSAIFNRIAMVGAGPLNQAGTAELAPIEEGFIWLRVTPDKLARLQGSTSVEVDLAAAVALFPAGINALLSARVDAQVRVSRTADSLDISISKCSEPELLFIELSGPYDATHVLHLICDPHEDTGHTFVMVGFNAGKFTPNGWLDGETAAPCAAEGAKAKGRPPDFRGKTGKLPR